ncbi:MAG TPA: SprT-like domain-containing protein [Clostridia bacterium]|nr:SprT-like domain-containing protein [Clostridia bacterium]
MSSRASIENKRRKIAKQFMAGSSNIKEGTIRSISPEDLQLLFQLYDRVFLNNWFRDSYKGKIKFSFSKRMTRSAGKTICPKNIDRIEPEKLTIEIRIGVDFFFNYGMIQEDKIVCGVLTTNPLQALQLVFEHELCHVIEFIRFKKSNCNGDIFKTMALNMFGHTESNHKLPTYRQIARQKFGLNIGDRVSFTFENMELKGILYNINKRATVMVRDKEGTMVDNKGNRYTKYYIPISMLNAL